MKILEKEIELREETRALEQARAALASDEFEEQALPLAETQEALSQRTGEVIHKIREIPEGDQKFGKEIALLTRVEHVMDEARDILAGPDTGPQAIAAETEAIELLLMAKRINPNDGGGGGSSPGGGGGGTTEQSALALLGAGDDRDANVQHKQTEQATGTTGRQLPEEFVGGLDAYFNAMENGAK